MRGSNPLTLVLSAALLVGCSGTGGTLGDQPAKPLADEIGDGSRLAERNEPVSVFGALIGKAPWVDATNSMSAGCLYPPERNVYVTGVSVAAVDRFDETGDGKSDGTYYAQDLPGGDAALPYSGIDIFSPSFSPPDLRLSAGDVVDMLGVYQEFKGPSTFIFPQCKTLPEFSGTLTFRFESGVLVPKTLHLSDLKTYAKARPWLGMLVRVVGDPCTTAAECPVMGNTCAGGKCKLMLNNGSGSKGRYSADLGVGSGTASDVPQVTNELYDLPGQGPMLPEGAEFTSITGIVTFFAQFHVAPRSPADFEP